MIPASDETALRALILQKGLATLTDLEHLQGASKPFAEELVASGLVAEDIVLELVAGQIGVPYMKLKDAEIEPDAIHAVPVKYADHYGIMPVRLADNGVMVAMTDPLDVQRLDEIRMVLDRDIHPLLASQTEIVEAVRTHYGVGAGILDKLSADGPETAEIPKDVEEASQDASVVEFVNQLLREAHRDRATDIHLEPFPNELRVRHRVDGVLYETKIPKSIVRFREAILSRIKIMAGMDIVERKLPQDGRFRIRLEGDDVDVRLATAPTPFGESLTLRLLVHSGLVNLDQVGFESADLKRLRGLIARPHGMVLITGPTGSGKTTTLYACLNELNGIDRKILTIEDPVEYEMRGITQIQVQSKVGLSFARGLRSMLRHDPDVMMVGEIRDAETADVAVRVSLTGHLVFSTLHTNDAVGTVTRLLDIGVEPYLIASCVHGIVAQRLVRLICENCREDYKPGPEQLQVLGMARDAKDDQGNPVKFFKGKGCPACRGSGYRGRTAIYEILEINAALREMVMDRASADRLREAAQKSGTRFLSVSGRDKALQGLTTVEEILRVTQAANEDDDE